MRIEIKNLMGIASAAVEFAAGKVVEIVGPNASGKTSFATALQAVLARDANPAGLPAPQARRAYLRDGCEEGSATLETGDTRAVWEPHKQAITAPADDPASRPEVVGLIDFCARKAARERAAAFQEALLPPPETVLAQLRERLAQYLPPQDLEGAMEHVERRGWKATEGLYRDRSRAAKRDWAGITGRPYGVRLANDWRPDSWNADWDGMTAQDAEAAVVTARDAAAALHAVTAVTEAEIEAAREADEQIPGVEVHLLQLKGTLEAAREAEANIRQRIAALREERRKLLAGVKTNADDSDLLACPCCHAELAMVNKTGYQQLIPFDRPVHEANERLHKAEAERLREIAATEQLVIHSVEAELREAEGDTREKQTHQIRLEDALRGLRQKAKALGKEVESEARERALAEADQERQNAEAVVAMVKARSDAEKLHETAARYGAVADALGPQGVRQRLLDKGLRRLNAGLAVLADTAEWPAVEVVETGAVTIGGRAATLCSESEKWRAQTMLQLTLAPLTGSTAVVLDRADLLDPTQRGGLIRAVQRVTEKVPVAVVLCSTGVPDETAPWRQVRTGDWDAFGDLA